MLQCPLRIPHANGSHGVTHIESPTRLLLFLNFCCFFFFFKHVHTALFIYFWLLWIFIAERGLSLVAKSWGYSLIVVHRLLVVVASLAGEHRI